jgi:hypothetical protein
METTAGGEGIVSACRSCGAEIVWAVTEKGRRQPFDVKPHPEGRWTLDEATDEEGRPVKLARYVPLAPTASLFADPFPRFVPHHATCPDSEDWH